MRYLLYGGKTVTGKAVEDAVILIEGERLGRIFHTSGDEESRRLAESFMKSDRQTRLIDLKGRLVFAGGIDAHVHFREPGMTQKADIATESLAALRGGVTSFMDMYPKSSRNLLEAVFSIVTALSRASAVDVRYARTSPGIPSLIPPKYLVTTTRTSLSPRESICPRMGLPEDPDGSPSSFALYLSPRCPSLHA